MTVIVSIALPIAVGFVVGILSGLLGVGGGTIFVPLFRLVFGCEPLGATATSLFTIIPTSISGAVSHLKGRTCLPALGVVAGLGGALMSPLGVRLAVASPPLLVMSITAAVIAYSAVTMLLKARRKNPNAATNAATKEKKPSSSQGDVSAVQSTHLASAAKTEEAFAVTRKQLAQGFVIGMGAGVASGYIGLGGGFLMVPLMTSLMHLPMKKISGTSLIAVMILAVPAVVQQAMLGNVSFALGAMVAIGSIPGAFVGARLIKRIPERNLRMLFGVFLCFAALLLVLKETGVF